MNTLNTTHDLTSKTHIVGTAFGGQLYTVTNILAGLSMSLYASWQFSLGLLVVMPIFTVAAILEMVLFTGSESKIRGVLDPVMSFVNEAVRVLQRPGHPRGTLWWLGPGWPAA